MQVDGLASPLTSDLRLQIQPVRSAVKDAQLERVEFVSGIRALDHVSLNRLQGNILALGLMLRRRFSTPTIGIPFTARLAAFRGWPCCQLAGLTTIVLLVIAQLLAR